MADPSHSSTGSTGLVDPTEARANCGVGVVMDLDGDRTNRPVADGIELLENLEHRGTTGADPDTGDGAGILLQTPHDVFADEVDGLPDRGEYAVGSIFMPQDRDAAAALQDLVESVFADHDLETFAWREVPTDNDPLGRTAVDSEPLVVQCFVRSVLDDDAFDRALFVARRDLERYNTLVDAVRPTFAENEARLLLDVFNDKRFEPIETTLRLLWASLDDAEDIYYQKHGVEKEAFVSRIHDLSEAEALATIDAIERFWNHSNRATPQSVGLCETD